MQFTATRFGRRYQCSVDGCTMACWGGKTSTPADDETRAARIQAHDAFDPIWKGGGMKRGKAYKWLDDARGVPRGSTHIGQSNVATCEEIVRLSDEYKQSNESE